MHGVSTIIIYEICHQGPPCPHHTPYPDVTQRSRVSSGSEWSKRDPVVNQRLWSLNYFLRVPFEHWIFLCNKHETVHRCSFRYRYFRYVWRSSPLPFIALLFILFFYPHAHFGIISNWINYLVIVANPDNALTQLRPILIYLPSVRISRRLVMLWHKLLYLCIFEAYCWSWSIWKVQSSSPPYRG